MKNNLKNDKKFVCGDNYELYNQDNVKAMDFLIEQGVQVDLTVAGPPCYDLQNKNRDWSLSKFKKVAKRLYNLTKDGGIVVWVTKDITIKGSETGMTFKQVLYFKEIGFNLHDTMIWNKPNPAPQARRKKYINSFEYMFIFSKGEPKTCNYLTTPCRLDDKKEKIKTNIWSFDNGMAIKDDKFSMMHPATFPEKLAEDHILSWSNEGDIVFDCFMGVNTTGKMALLNNRKFIGIEKVEGYFQLSHERIQEHCFKN